PIDICRREAVRAVASCDILFGCVDSADARDVMNRISTCYLIPYIDMGTGIVALADGSIDQINGIVHYLQPGMSSLLDRGAYRAEQVRAEAQWRRDPVRYEALRKEKYIEGLAEEEPAVISVNAAVSSLAVHECLA